MKKTTWYEVSKSFMRGVSKWFTHPHLSSPIWLTFLHRAQNESFSRMFRLHFSIQSKWEMMKTQVHSFQYVCFLPKVLCTLLYTRWQHIITSNHNCFLSPLLYLYTATVKYLYLFMPTISLWWFIFTVYQTVLKQSKMWEVMSPFCVFNQLVWKLTAHSSAINWVTYVCKLSLGA